MPKKKEKRDNLRIARIFILLVFGLIVLSAITKLFILFKESKFDGTHKINVVFYSRSTVDIASFSPQGKSISLLKTHLDKNKNISELLDIPIDGEVWVSSPVEEKNISSQLLKSLTPFGNSFKSLTVIDIFRLFLFSKSVNSNSQYVRDYSDDLNINQKSTIISLTFQDPQVYQENQSIEVINASSVNGLGGRLANLITNIGGNVILISSPTQDLSKQSKIVYFGEKTYTIKMLGKYLDFPIIKTSTKQIADVIIILGTDKLGEKKF